MNNKLTKYNTKHEHGSNRSKNIADITGIDSLDAVIERAKNKDMLAKLDNHLVSGPSTVRRHP